ncbi:MAG: hypothetical protein EB078_08325 [Proteobacteria bacterium]|nr:hypothetical protein [Pseudomonadota bacterium]NDC25033.1 hypothetical protein [Pseudomonadota bacterium]NDD04897.1 hypothetical protein [Pseudomonadota bacterium]NDG27365.1 hypothetical protein [Pseudomonadota bacterium]
MFRNKSMGLHFVFILVYLSGQTSVLGSVPPVNKYFQIMWVEKPGTPFFQRKKIFAKEFKMLLENQWGGLLKNGSETVISPEKFRIWKRLETIDKTIVQLWNMLFPVSNRASEKDLETREAFEQVLKQEVSTLDRGQYGPLLQKAKLALAAAHWRRGEQKQAVRLVKEAKSLHPRAEATELISSDNLDGITFDALVSSLNPDSLRHSCRLNLNNIESIAQLWVNGFRMDVPLAQIQEGLHHFVAQNKSGLWSEKVLRCAGQRIDSGEWNWTSSVQFNWETGLGDNRLGSQESCLVVEPVNTSIKSWLYSDQTGFVGCPGYPIAQPNHVSQPSSEFIHLVEKCVSTNSAKFGLNKQGLNQLSLSELLIASNTSQGISDTKLREEKWYNKPTSWLVLGGVVATLVLAVANQPRTSKPSPTWIAIKMDSQ